MTGRVREQHDLTFATFLMERETQLGASRNPPLIRCGGREMFRTIDAVIDEDGTVTLHKPVHLPASRRALLVILADEAETGLAETAILSETALSEDWDRPEEGAAWSHLQPEP